MMSESEARLTDELRLAHLEIKLLKQKLDALARRLFGRSSEPERSGDRQPQAARRAQAKPESEAGCGSNAASV